MFIAAPSSAQKEHVVSICEPGWTDVGEKFEMGFLFMKRIYQKTPLIEEPAPFLGMSFTPWCKKWCRQSTEIERCWCAGVLVVVAEKPMQAVKAGMTVVLGSNEPDLSQIRIIC